MSDNVDISDSADQSKIKRSNLVEHPGESDYQNKSGTECENETPDVIDACIQSKLELPSAIESTRHEGHIYINVEQGLSSSPKRISEDRDLNRVSDGGSETPVASRDMAGPSRLYFETNSKNICLPQKRQFWRNYNRLDILGLIRGRKRPELKLEDEGGTNANDSAVNVNRDNTVALPKPTYLEVETTGNNYHSYLRRFQFWKKVNLIHSQANVMTRSDESDKAVIGSKIIPLIPLPDGPLDITKYLVDGRPPLNIRREIDLKRLDPNMFPEGEPIPPFLLLQPYPPVRNCFIAKMYTILSCLLIAMLFVVHYSRHDKEMNSFIKKNGLYIGVPLWIFLSCPLLVCNNIIFPVYLLLLITYTTGVAMVWATVSCYLSNEIVYLVIGGIAAVTIYQLLMSLVCESDIMEVCFHSVFIGMLIYAVICALLMNNVDTWKNIPEFHLAGSIIIAFLYSMFLQYITIYVVSEIRVQIGPHQWIYGASVIYVDATNIYTFFCR